MNNRVAVDDVTTPDGKALHISTVRLPFTIGWPIPFEFETMVFPKGAWGDLYCERYESKTEAAAGHTRIVECAKRGDYTNPEAASRDEHE